MTVSTEASDISRGCDMTVGTRPTFVEQQLPPWDNVATVQPLLFGATTEVSAVEERADEQAAASSSEAATSASTATYIAVGTEACDMTGALKPATSVWAVA